MSMVRLPPGLDRFRDLAGRHITGPALEALAALWRLLRQWRAPRPLVLRPYVDQRGPLRVTTRILFPLGLAVLGLIYGFYFALTAPFLLVPFAAPVILLVLMAVWALPASATAPTRTTEFFFCSVFIGLVLWPNYLALSLPGLPWITMIRLTGFPMAMLFLVSVSISDDLRRHLGAALSATAPIWTLMLVFIAMQIVTIPLAKDPGGTIQRVLVQQVNWTCIFLIAVYIFGVPGRAQGYVNLLMLLAIPIVIVSILEGVEQRVLWAEHVPSFLKIDDPVAASLLGAHTRGATGLYRVKATFSTALGLAEYISLLTPFAIHYAVGPYSRLVKLLGLAALPVIFYVVRLTDARLGVVGFLGSFLMYSLIWALVRFRRTRGDLLSATIVYSYPTIAGLLMIGINASHRLNMLVFGGNAQAASNYARENQLLMGIPKVLQNPIGFGAIGSGPAMGYAEGQFVTVDNYYLTLGLNYGVVGLTTFIAIFLVGIGYAVRYGLEAVDKDDRELLLLLPLAAALAAFLVIKSVFSQPDNHSILFLMLGMIVALVYRTTHGDAAEARHR